MLCGMQSEGATGQSNVREASPRLGHPGVLVRDRISKIRNLLPVEQNLIKFEGVAHDNQLHDILQYFL